MMPNQPEQGFMEVRNSKMFGCGRIPVERIPLGTAGDYKPCVARLPDGTLLVSAYRTTPALHGSPHADYHDWTVCSPQRRYLETTLLFRSTDGGRTWPAPRLANIGGKEPYLTVTGDGTVFITAHLVEQNILNQKGYCYGLLHRSADSGRSWSTVCAQPQNANPARYCYYDLTTRNVLELADGSLFFVASGVGRDANTVWRSTDGGHVWDVQYRAEVEGQPDGYLWSAFGEGVLWQTRSGKIYCILRVDCRGWPDMEEGPLEVESENRHDNYDRMVLYASTDLGRTWQKVRDFGTYGQMYPSILRLADGRLLLTFTQRALEPPLGLRAVLGTETDDGFEFDFTQDLIMIDTKTPEGLNSGGGFGRTIQLDDGVLVTSYSYRTQADDFAGEYAQLHLELARWRLPE